MTTPLPDELPTFDHRPGAGPTLVFLHYWGGSGRTWHAVVDLLPRADVLTVDFRGWGRSAGLPGPYSLNQYAADISAVLERAGVTDFVLVGHSMGGKVAQLVAATRPTGLRGLALVAPGPAKPGPTITAEYQDALSHAYDSDESVTAARDHILTASAISPDQAATVLADSGASNEAARYEWPLRGIAEDITDQTRMIEVPTVVIAGEHDQVEPVDVLRDNLLPFLDRVEFRVVSGSGHLIPLEAPGSLAAEIETFARSV